MCVRMLQVLNTGRIYKVIELAEILETNPRNIIEYKKELDEVAACYGAGFYIETVPARYGGYKLNGDAVLPALTLKQEEMEALLESYHYSIAKKDLGAGFGKVVSNVQIEEKEKRLLVVDKYQLSMKEQDIGERYAFGEKAKAIEERYA